MSWDYLQRPRSSDEVLASEKYEGILLPKGSIHNIKALELCRPDGGLGDQIFYIQLGYVLGNVGGHTGFLVIWTLDSHEFLVIFDPKNVRDQPEGMLAGSERVDVFPGTGIRLSVGRLSRVLDGEELTLEVKGSSGFYIRDVERVDRMLRVMRVL
jgi:hypothetical protein